MIENLLKPDKDRREQEPPKEAPAKIKALSMAAQLAGLKFPYFGKIRERKRDSTNTNSFRLRKLLNQLYTDQKTRSNQLAKSKVTVPLLKV